MGGNEGEFTSSRAIKIMHQLVEAQTEVARLKREIEELSHYQIESPFESTSYICAMQRLEEKRQEIDRVIENRVTARTARLQEQLNTALYEKAQAAKVLKKGWF